MDIINIYEAKTHLSKILDRVAAGEDIVIARAGRPLVKLVAFEQPTHKRRPGLWRGRVQIAPDFDDLPDSLQRAFEGKTS